MAKKSLYQYSDNESYTADASSRPVDSSVVSEVSSQVEYKGVNIVVDALPQNVEVGDMLIYDKQTLKHKILKMKTYNSSSFDTDRYIKSDMLWHQTILGTGLFLYKTMTSARWGAQCEFKLSGFDLTQAGSFTFLSTGYQAKAEATTISWEANATLESVRAQLTTGNGGVIGSGSYSSAVIDGTDIIVMVGGYGTNNITIGSLSGGAEGVTLTDYSKVCKIGDTFVSDTDTHRSFEGSTVATCFPSLAGELLPVTTASYTVCDVNRPYRCGMYFPTFKAYVSTNGSSTFVDDTTSGSSFPMTLAKFNACATSEVEAEVACYNRHKGSYDSYLRAAMADHDTLKGTVGQAEQNFGKQGKLLASIMYKDHNDEWKPCYPAAYAASQMGVTVVGYTTGFEPGNLHFVDTNEGVSFMREGVVEELNANFAKIGGMTLGSSYLWFSSEYDASNAWLYYAGDGDLGSNRKLGSYGVCGGLAFKF